MSGRMPFPARASLPIAVAWVAALATPVAAQQDTLDLAAALRVGRIRSPVLKAENANVRGAYGRMVTARSARLPHFSAEGLYLRYEDPPAVTLGSPGAFPPIAENAYVAGARVTQTLFSSGRVAASIRGAEASARAAELTAAQVEVELTAAIAHAHDDVLLASSLQEVAERRAAVLRRAVAVAKARYEEGTAARLDVLRAETRLSSADAALRAVQDAGVDARERLALLIGLDPSAAPPVVGRLDVDVVPPRLTDGSLSKRATATPAVEAQRAAAEAARASATAARASRRPTLGLFLMTLTSRPEFGSGERRWGWELAGGVTLSWPFFDGGEATGRAAMADADADRAEAGAAREELEIVAAVRAQRRSLRRAMEDVVAGRANVSRAERALAIAEERYADGIGLQLDVFEAEADLTHVRVELLTAVHAYRGAAVELRRALGVPADASLIAPEGE